MAITPISSRDDILKRLGPPSQQRQLLDPDRTLSAVNYAAVDQACLDATGEIQAILESKFKLYSDGNYPQRLKTLDAMIAVKCLYVILRVPVPEDVMDGWRYATSILAKIEAGETAPGSPFAQTRLSRVIDNTDGGRRYTYEAFRRGGLLGGR